MRIRPALILLGAAAALFGLWLLLVDTFERPELLAGAAASIIAVVAAAASCRKQVDWATLLHGLRGVLPLPLHAARDSGIVLAAVVLHALRVRPIRSKFIATPFDVGGGSRRDGTRRALATITSSFPPNTAVLGFRRQDGVQIQHELVPRTRGRARTSSPA